MKLRKITGKKKKLGSKSWHWIFLGCLFAVIIFVVYSLLKYGGSK